MIRLSALALLIGFLCVYAFKDWFKSLCGLILLMAVMQHPDMPKSMLGIQGANPWNITMLFVIIGWFSARTRERLNMDMPGLLAFLLVSYLLIIMVGFLRFALSREHFDEFSEMIGFHESFGSLLSEYIINCMKWMLPGLLLFDGARDRQRVIWATVAIVTVYVLLAIQVIRWMPLGSLGSGVDLEYRSAKIIQNEIGYNRVNMAAMLAGAFWAVFSMRDLLPNKKHHLLIYVFCLACLLALALTGGRTGYATWAAVGGIFCLVRYRKLLMWSPVPVLLVVLFVPAAQERLLMGFGGRSVDSNVALESTLVDDDGATSWYTVSSGRNIAWPYVLEKIGERPAIGYGREAMINTGLTTMMIQRFGESFPHPHNAYLQWIFDNGLLGFIPVMMFYYIMLRNSFSLFREKDNPLHSAVGGVSLALLLSLLIAGFGSQTFYPREGAMGMWCAFGLMLRLYLERAKGPAGAFAVKDEKDETDQSSVADNRVRPLWETLSGGGEGRRFFQKKLSR